MFEIRSPYPWMGGKFFEKKWIIPLMPKHEWYGEVFFGSGVLLLNKPKANEEFGNDLFSCLVSFWNTLKSGWMTRRLWKKMQETLDSRYDYQRYMALNPEDLSMVDRAYRFLYLTKFGFNCYDSKTEVLTKKGWKFFRDLKYSDKVATTSGDDLYYTNPVEIQNYDYDGDMVKISHRSIDLLITPNHNLYVKQGDRKEYEFVKANDVSFRHTRFLNSVNWSSYDKEWFYLPKVEHKHNIYVEKYKMDDWLVFLGWYITEGFTVKTKESYVLGIAQSKENNRIEIKNLLDRLNIHYNDSRKDQILFYGKQLYKYLKQLGKAHQKYIPQEFMNLSKRQLQILFDALIKGDGSVEKSGRIKYYTTSKRLADQLQEIIIKLGKNSTLYCNKRQKVNEICGKKVKNIRPIYIINLRKTKEVVTDSLQHYSKEYYKGKVYCCTVEPYHTLLVRRNGRPTWCGNSYMNTYYSPASHEIGKIKDFVGTWLNTAQDLFQYHNRVQKIHFSNYDFREFLTKIKPNSKKFLFLDPPYMGTHGYEEYYKNGKFPNSFYDDMRDHLKRHHEGGTMWQITCDQKNTYFDNMDDIIIQLVDRRACINKNEERVDVKTKIIMNYDVRDTGSCYEMIEKNEIQGDGLLL